MSSLQTVVSGMEAASAGLYVTGHNMANSETEGYSRQQAIQSELFNRIIGYSKKGALQVGLGVTIAKLRQLRDRFLDHNFRTENSRLGFYSVLKETGTEIESTLGETESEYHFQTVFNDIWNSLNELSAHPEGFETRGNFIAMSNAFITKVDDIYNRLFDYQHNLDLRIRQEVTKLNELVGQINTLNKKITEAETANDHANDYRDLRNVCLDQLSGIITFEAKEKSDGSIDITSEGNVLLSNGSQNHIGLKYISGSYEFVEPVITESAEILPSDQPIDQFKSLFTFNKPIAAKYKNDDGSLKGLLIARGTRPANYLGETAIVAPDSSDYIDGINDDRYKTALRNYNNDIYSVQNCLIPKVMLKLDKLVHEVVTQINDSLAPGNPVKDPNAPYDLYNNRSYTEVFTRKKINRWNGNILIKEEPDNYYTQYTIGNLEVNPILMEDGGGNFLALSISGDREDNRLILDLLDKWNEKRIDIGGAELLNITDAYKRFISDIGTETKQNYNFVTEENVLTEQTNIKRSRIMSVSLDEEMKNMMTYQHAFSASARMLNVIDSMLDKLINGTGRVGL